MIIYYDDINYHVSLESGVLMDYSREESIKTALRFGMATFNNKREKRFTLTDETLLLPMDNSFKVGSASKWNGRLHVN